MPMYDKVCDVCGATHIDIFEPVAAEPTACDVEGCSGTLRRSWTVSHKASGVIGDEIDITVKHGLCNPDGSPRRYTSRIEMAREAHARGMTNLVEHKGTKSGDKSPHTSRWV